MEVEENQPPQKKLKQATLSFFKGRKEDTSKKTEVQGRKRQSSTGSDSPSKIAKLSRPLAVLGSSDSPNSKIARPGTKTNCHDSSDQEVSSSSEADSTGNKDNVKCLMDRFVKKVHNNHNEEISSTNDDVDSTDNNMQAKKNKSENDKENTIEVEGNNVDSDSDCKIVSDKTSHSDEHKTDSIAEAPVSANKIASVKSEEKNGNVKTCPEKNENKIEENIITIVSDNEDIEADPVDFNKSIESDLSESFSKPLDEESGIICTSTPAKSVQESADDIATPLSSKKRGKKVDLAKRAEKEALKQKQKEEREELRLAKKKKLEEEKAEKEKLRKEKQEAKEKEKQELKEKQAQEKMAKEKLKEEERMKKEEERKLKEEQRLKKQAELEAKQEEKKKKEEEKKQREEEKQKEDEEKRKKEEKVKMAFQSFFKTKETPQKATPSKSSSSGFFVPFELKKDMHLAPTLRRDALCQQKKHSLDEALKPDQPSSPTYLDHLKNKSLKPRRNGRRLRKNPKPADEMDVEIIHNSEALKKVFHKVKILQFHTDNRPPYFGTWRKETKLSPRNPYKKDEDVFDYEVDSDEEWEEEEPGESLSCSDGEEEKEEKEEDEEEDGWMVPHGYLSEDEGCNEDDDDISPEKLKLQQIAKAKAWDEEQKRKFQALPVVVIGCFFEHSPSVTMSGDVRLLYEYKAVLEKDTPIPTALSTAFEVPASDDVSKESDRATPGIKGPKKQNVPDEAMPDLIRLVHGNVCGIKKLIKEFRLFWFRKNNPQTSSLNGSFEDDPDESMKDQTADVSMDSSGKDQSEVLNKSHDANTSISKPKDDGHNCKISKRQLEIKIMAMAVREKRQCLKKTSWFVHDTVLAEFGMTDIQLPNSWVFLTSGPAVSPATKVSSVPAPNKEEDNVKKDESTMPAKSSKDQRSIMDFTITKEEMEAIKQSQGEPLTKSANNLNVQEISVTVVEQPVTPKEKKSSGQRSIMDFAKSAEKCSEKNQKSKAVTNSSDVVVKKDDSNKTSIKEFANTVAKNDEKNISSEVVEDSSHGVMKDCCDQNTGTEFSKSTAKGDESEKTNKGVDLKDAIIIDD